MKKCCYLTNCINFPLHQQHCKQKFKIVDNWALLFFISISTLVNSEVWSNIKYQMCYFFQQLNKIPILIRLVNKTGLQPVSRIYGTTPFGFQDSRRKNRQAQNFAKWTPKWTPLTPKRHYFFILYACFLNNIYLM